MMLVTNRLTIKEFQLQDAPFVLALVNTPNWIKYIGDRSVYNITDAENYLRNRLMAAYSQHGFGMYAVWHKEKDCPIGMCGLVQRDYLEFPDLGFALLPDFVRKGYAFEASQSVIIFAEQELKLRQLFAITLPDNLPSNGLLKKLGFQFERNFSVEEDEKELCLYQKQL